MLKAVFLNAFVFCSFIMSENVVAQTKSLQRSFSLYGVKFDTRFDLKEISESESLQLVDSKFTTLTISAIHNAMPFASRLIDQADSLNFPDWLRLKLVVEFAKRTSKKSNQRVYAAMVILRAMGYNAGIIILSGRWQLAIEIDQKIFFATVFEEQKKRFCIYDLEKNELIKVAGESDGFYDANENLGQTLEPLALFQDGLPSLPFEPIKKSIMWKFGGESFSLSFTLNKHLVNYHEERPQMDVATYFNETIPKSVYQELILPLKKIVVDKGFSDRQAIAFLHSFVLYGFEYKDDLKTKRGEHTNSIQETLVSEYSDCEDRSILLSVVIRGVLGFSVLGIEYPNHLTLGVSFPNFQKEESDETYEFNGRQFLSADPSCFGSLGNTNPDFKGKKPVRYINIEPLAIAGKDATASSP